MTTDTPAIDTQAPPPEIEALIAAAASHPDPWFAALASSYLTPKPPEGDIDVELTTRLESQAAAGDYTPLDVFTEEAEAPGPHGPVRLRIYRPNADVGGRPLLVWCHGGGWVGGDIDMPEADATARELCVRAGAVVVSVDYRLATQGVHYPVPHDDVYAAYSWAVARAEDLNARSSAVIGGGSAGANLAAGVALRLRDEGTAPAGVLLLYPAVHPVLPPASDELASKLALLPSQHGFRPDVMKPVVENYVGGPLESTPTYAMPGLADDLCNYPPTLVINCEYDGLRASGEAFAAQLEAADVDVTQMLALDVLHGHINSPWLSQAQQSYADMADWLTRISA